MKMKSSIKIISVLLLVSLLFAVFAVGAAAASVSVEDPTTGEPITEKAPLLSSEQKAKIKLIVISVAIGMLSPVVVLSVFVIKLIKKRREIDFVDYIIIATSLIWLASGSLVFGIIL